jgi:hypothetical protein
MSSSFYVVLFNATLLFFVSVFRFWNFGLAFDAILLALFFLALLVPAFLRLPEYSSAVLFVSLVLCLAEVMGVALTVLNIDAINKILENSGLIFSLVLLAISMVAVFQFFKSRSDLLSSLNSKFLLLATGVFSYSVSVRILLGFFWESKGIDFDLSVFFALGNIVLHFWFFHTLLKYFLKKTLVD